MLSNTDSAIKALNREQELSKILELLDPPLDQLASETGLFLFNFPEPSIEGVLASYFELFALGYTLWDRTYYYHSIHEYFYGAYLRARQLAADLPHSELERLPEPERLIQMLEPLSRAFIAFTWYENALARNDPKGAYDSVNGAITFIEKALELLDLSSLADSLKAPIKKYLKNNCFVLYGLHYSVKIYLAALKNEEIPPTYESEINHYLSEISSSELQTYLRVQYSFALGFAEAHAQKNSDLYVKEGQILLRTIGYVGEDLITALFDRLTGSSTTLEEVREDIRNKTLLPLESVRSSYMHDIFETTRGKEYLEQIIFDLAIDHFTKNHVLTFFIRDGEKGIVYPITTFQVCFTRFGTISVEFGIAIKDASVSHVRVLESLIGPDTIQFDFFWRGAPSDTERGITNFVDSFLNAQEWVRYIRQEMPTVGTSIVKKMNKVLEDWETSLKKLASLLPRSSVESQNMIEKQTDQLEDVHKHLQNRLNTMFKLANEWIEEASSLGYSESELVKLGRQFLPRGVRFGRLMDITEEVLKRIKLYLLHTLCTKNHKDSNGSEEVIVDCVQAYLRPNSSKKNSPSSKIKLMDLKDDVKLVNLNEDIRQLFYFDSNTGWAAILSCNRLTINEHNQRTNEPAVGFDNQSILDHPEFKGLIMPNRAARVSLDDWLFAVAPAYRNLAPFRFHKNDILKVSENHAYLYMPEEPEWVVKQVIETIHLISDLRTLVLTFNIKTRNQLNGLMSYFNDLRYSHQNEISGKNLRRLHNELLSKRDVLLSKRNEIEDLREHAENILDLLRSCTISKYQDHSDLLKEMIKESKVNDYREALEHNIENLDRFHTSLTQDLQRQIDEDLQKSNEAIQATQMRINWLLAILTPITALAAIPAIYQFLSPLLGDRMGANALQLAMTVLFLGVLLGSSIAIVIAWLLGRKT